MQHYLNQMVEEYSALPEPLSDFYDILCIGLDWNDDEAPHISHLQPLSSYPGSSLFLLFYTSFLNDFLSN